jgi:AcrR family transcriptional regulator
MHTREELQEGGPDREARGRATRAALVAAARAAFGSRGYEATTLDQIVEAAAVTKGAFYHHFASKKELFAEVFREVEHAIAREAFPTAESAEEVWRLLEDRCRRYIELHLDPAVRRIVLVDAPRVLAWEERRHIEENEGVAFLSAELARLSDRGLLKPLHTRTLAQILGGARTEACMLVAAAEDPDEALERAMAVLRAFIGGLRAEEAPEPPRHWLP